MVAQSGEVCPPHTASKRQSQGPTTPLGAQTLTRCDTVGQIPGLQPTAQLELWAGAAGAAGVPGPLPREARCRSSPPSRVPILILAWRPATEALVRGRLELCGTAVSWHAGWGLFSRLGHKPGDTELVSLPRVFPPGLPAPR